MNARTLTVVSAVGLLAASLTAAPALAAPAPGGANQARTHKVVYPTVPGAAAARAARAAAGATSVDPLAYGGGVDGIGVSIAAPQVYLIFWGSQWGTQGTDANGNLTLSGDTKGMAPLLQRMFKGIGTGTDLWSGVMTQYCEGDGVSVVAGSTSCPSTAAHVAVPRNGAYRGVWYDGAVAAPSKATDHQIGVEAYAGLQHFKPVSGFDLRNAQFVVVSPSGTHPGGFNSGIFGPQFCAWHDYNGDTTLNGGAITSPEGDFAFTNMPYVTDLGASCGANYVNSGTAGATDGVTMVSGHEYAETITDMNPAGGWVDSTTAENADKCAWIGVGGTGGSQNVAFPTGSFAMQGTWSNDGETCLIAHAIVTNNTSGNVVAIGPVYPTATTVTFPVTPFDVSGTDTGTGETLTWTVSGLPAGTTFTPSVTGGTFGGRPTTDGSFTVSLTATDTTGASASKSFVWVVARTTVMITSATGNQQTARNTTVSGPTLTATTNDQLNNLITWSATGAPPGVSIGQTTGIFTGKTGRKTGTYTVKATAKDATGSTATYTFTWTVK